MNSSDATFGWNGFHNTFSVYYKHPDAMDVYLRLQKYFTSFDNSYDHFIVLNIFFSIRVSNFFTLGEFAFSYPKSGYVLSLFPDDEDKSVQVNLISTSLFNTQAVGND